MPLSRLDGVRSAAVALLLTSSQIAAANATDRAPSITDEDLLILQLRLGRSVLSDGLIGYQTGLGTCVVIDDLVRALEFPITVSDGVASGWFIREDRIFRLDVKRREVEVDGKTRALNAHDAFDTFGDICISLQAASEWFAISFELDFENATITAETQTPLPIEQREARRKRREQLNAALRAVSKDEEGVEPTYKWASWPIIDASVATNTSETANDIGGDFVLTTDFSKLSAEVYAAANSDDGFSTVRARIGRSSAAGDLGGALTLTQAIVGDVAAPQNRLSAATKNGRGAFISNYALYQPDIFDSTTLRGELLDGWEVELYRNGVLLNSQMSREDGRYEFIGIPILFGENEFKLIFYGPQGQVREEFRDFYAGDALTPKGKTQGFLALSQQETATLFERREIERDGAGDFRLNGRIQHGLTKRLSIGLGVASYTLRDSRKTFVDASVQANLGIANVIIDGSADIEGAAAAAVSLQSGVGGVSLFASHEEYFDYESELTPSNALDPIHRRSNVRADFILPLRRRSSLPVTTSLQYSEFSSGRKIVDGAARVSAAIGAISISKEVLATWQYEQNLEDLRLSGRTLFNYYTRLAVLRGEVAYQFEPRARFASAAVTADFRIRETFGGRITTSYNPQTEVGDLGFSLNHDLGRFAIGGFGRIASDDSYTAGLTLSFSLTKIPGNRKWSVRSKPAARTGSAFVRVFVDNDNDDTFSSGDELLPEAKLLVNGQRSPNGASVTDGTLMGGLPPFGSNSISVDMSSVNDPYLINGGKMAHTIITRPGVTVSVDIPLSKTGEVVGETVMIEKDGSEAIGDVSLQLVDRDGRVIARAVSEFDGFFLFDKVPYGDYTIEVDSEQVQRLGISAETKSDIKISSENDVIEGVRIEISKPLGASI
ncbi:MAG: hypothetical protein AAF720_06225 [Pseudomonadota bacterium]